MPGKHTLISPSGMARIMGCAGSLFAEMQSPPSPPNPAAEEGTRAHDYAATELKRYLDSGHHSALPKRPTDMMIYAHAWADYLYDTYDESGVEESFDIPAIWSGMKGTVDFWGFISKLNLFRIADYKYGHRPVSAFECWQLMAYACGLLNGRTVSSNTTIELIIFQPRAPRHGGPADVWSTTVGELKPYWARMQSACMSALAGKAGRAAGEHCYKCRARYACDELQRVGLLAAEYIQQPYNRELPVEALSVELDTLRKAQILIKERLEALEEYAIGRIILKGDKIPCYTAKETSGKLKWTSDIDTVVREFGKNVLKPRELVTPTQASAFNDNDKVMEHARRDSGKLKLVRSDPNEAARIFGGKR